VEYGHNYDRRRRRRSLRHVYSDVGYCAQRTVRVTVGVRVDVRDLHGTGEDHQHDTKNRQENSPWMLGTALWARQTHIP
jgi:hypothetical protein